MAILSPSGTNIPAPEPIIEEEVKDDKTIVIDAPKEESGEETEISPAALPDSDGLAEVDLSNIEESLLNTPKKGGKASKK